MQISDKGQFADLLTEVMAYYGRDASPFMLRIFWEGLKRFEFADVSRALNLHAQDPDRGQFAPKLADLTRLLEGSTTTQGMVAWAKVARAVGSVGRNQSVVFDDPLIHAVIDEMGGWTSLCVTDVDGLPFKAREFERRYAAYRLRRETPPYPPRLIGAHEAENRLQGYEREVRPVLVGDPDRARLVMEQGAKRPALRLTRAASAANRALETMGGLARLDAA